jgi:RNA polymerase sigma-70 factor (ECF subfamily)
MTRRTLENVSPNSWDWSGVRALCLAVTRSLLASPAAAEDAAQEAVVRVWRASTRYEIRDREAFVARIARREAQRLGSRDAVLARRTAAGVDLDAWGGAEPDGAPADAMRATELMAGLPEADRQVLRLRYLEDLTQAQVALRLGIPEGTAKVRLHRARKRLKREIRRDERE